MVTCDKGDWDIIEDIHEFNETWVKECIRVLADDGTIWISGTLHNHPSIDVILKKLNLWIINVQKPMKLTTSDRFKLTTFDRLKLTSVNRLKLTT
jgi:hypothetical protein